MVDSFSDRRRLLERAFGKSVVSTDGINAAVVCPYCGKKGGKKKLVIRLDDGRYHCWVCGAKGKNAIRLFEKFCPSSVSDARKWLGNPRKKLLESQIEEEKVVIQPPKDFILLANSSKILDPDVRDCYNYVVSRGVDIESMWRYKIGTCKTGRYRRRIVIPSFDSEGELNYVTARTIDDKNPKYLNSKVQKTNVIINEINIDWSKKLTIVEGPFDLLKCNVNSTCLLGSHLPMKSALFQEIARNLTPVVLALDPDAIDKSHKIARDLYSFGIDVEILSLKEGDVGDMSKVEFSNLLSSAKMWTDIDLLQNKISSIKSGSLV